MRKDEVKQKVQSLTAAAAATSKTSCAAQAQPTAFKPTAVRARVALPYSPSAAVRARAGAAGRRARVGRWVGCSSRAFHQPGRAYPVPPRVKTTPRKHRYIYLGGQEV